MEEIMIDVCLAGTGGMMPLKTDGLRAFGLSIRAKPSLLTAARERRLLLPKAA